MDKQLEKEQQRNEIEWKKNQNDSNFVKQKNKKGETHKWRNWKNKIANNHWGIDEEHVKLAAHINQN